jgi:hypothetical protein
MVRSGGGATHREYFLLGLSGWARSVKFNTGVPADIAVHLHPAVWCPPRFSVEISPLPTSEKFLASPFRLGYDSYASEDRVGTEALYRRHRNG